MPPPDARAGTAVAGQSIAATYFIQDLIAGQAAFQASGTVVNAGVAGAATFAGAGAMTPKPSVHLAGQASWAGAGVQAAAGLVERLAAMTVQGQGVLAAAGAIDLKGQAIFAGQGNQAADAQVVIASASMLIVGTSTWNAAGRMTYAAALQALGVGTFQAASTIERPGAALWAGQGAFTGFSTIWRQASASWAATGVLGTSAVVHLGGRATFVGQGTFSAVPRMVYAGAMVIQGQGTMTPFAVLVLWGRATFAGQGTFMALGVRVQEMPPRRIRIDVYAVDGVTRLPDGPVMDAMSVTYRQQLDRIGSWEARVPASAERADLFSHGREVRIYREGEGLVFRGLVDRTETTVRTGQEVMLVTGSSIARRLVFRNTQRGFQYQGATPSTIATALVAGTGFTTGTIGAFPNLVTMRADAAARWHGLEQLSKVTGFHVREQALAAQVDVDPLGVDSGLTLMNVSQASPNIRTNQAVIPLAGISVLSESNDLVNRVYPLGTGEVLNALDLRQSDRATPYAIQSVMGPNMMEYFLEDAASVAAYGLRERYIQVKEAIPLAASAAGFLAAGNALYDVAAAALTKWKDPLVVYGVQIPALKHLDDAGAYRFQVGDKVRLAFRGIAHRPDGSEAWLNVNQLLWLMGYERTFQEDGSDTWTWTVQTIDRTERDQIEELAEAISDIHALQVSPHPYTYQDIHGPYRKSTDATRFLELPVNYQDNVFMLHQAKVSVSRHQLLANVQAVADDGGTSPTSGPSSASSSSASSSTTTGASNTTSSGASSATTVAGGGSHDHRVMFSSSQVLPSPNDRTGNFTDADAQTAFIASGTAGTDHTHGISDVQGHSHTTQFPTRQMRFTMRNSSGSPFDLAFLVDHANSIAFGSFTDAYTYDTEVDHAHNMAHTHNIPHTHDMPHTHPIAHTHTVTIAAHNHALTYGIFLGGTIGNISRIDINGVNRTVALGGPWTADIQNLDITQYLQSNVVTGQPLRQINTVRVYSATLQDLIVSVKSLVTSSSLVPV